MEVDRITANNSTIVAVPKNQKSNKTKQNKKQNQTHAVCRFSIIIASNTPIRHNSYHHE